MQHQKTRVVITGMGTISPLGNSAQAFHEAQLQGKSGVRRIQRFDPSDLPVQIAGEVDLNPQDHMDARDVKRTDRFVHMGVAAAELALQDAKLNPEDTDRTRFGSLIGSAIGGMDTWESQSRNAWERGVSRVSPFFIPMLMANAASSHVAIRYGLQGVASSVSTACTTGADALGSAYRAIGFGEADVMLAGGTEAIITPLVISGFSNMKALSRRNNEPEKASRPFSAQRDGFVLGEGAAVLVLESLEHAQARGATILAEIVGFGRSADAHHITEPHPEGSGALLAIRAALKESGLKPEDIQYINAHATSTPVGDKAEAMALRSAFGEAIENIWVSSTKSMTGHLLGAAGSIEAIACVQAIQSGIVPPSINAEDADIHLKIAREPIKTEVHTALSNSFAFGGLNASLIFKRFEA
ncbi:beta-ketoacyl-ACP synthase II [Deinococcus cellulosilyticus]|uniref:3-oxoacyl-[acyl-carrier-protein] synthase 2 n=1 Tax=Deinococcus cellulosilyticus (strain DSM 18568 / NBRC 106333 / KACC 11606 / 5516J-15) TaxID=1223518 RepID=A0A511MV44_DEIC1|nr:beta-ketoacyl-ACP synthase II [Deinococcus cellulosilyticus]GEM44445.1 3-oxoacyl-[acyl-carrier-protein] synthase 2 [Deinococcus cellulosilyticus NBRC 106333 = KACC 11606]